ncbi:MAG: S1 RNA-binding domain-containing protein, partial [Cyanobacteria bacterium J06636_16]
RGKSPKCAADHDHIDTPHSVFNVNDEIKVMIIDLDAERGRISLSTKQLEPEPGDMVKNPDLVFDKAEEMAERYREQLRKKAEAEAAEAAGEVVEEAGYVDDEVEYSATEDED